MEGSPFLQRNKEHETSNAEYVVRLQKQAMAKIKRSSSWRLKMRSTFGFIGIEMSKCKSEHLDAHSKPTSRPGSQPKKVDDCPQPNP